MPEVQHHGFSWQNELIHNVYGATADELKSIKYGEKMDLPAELNRLDKIALSIKTTCSAEAVCMADCLRIFDAVSSDTSFHMVVIYYMQDDKTNTKKLKSITEVNLTNSVKLLFGSLTRNQLEVLDKAVKAVPQKDKPTAEQYKYMYDIRNSLQPLSGAIHLDIKCNSTQSRLQCSFNHFQTFLKENPNRIISTSTTGKFRGGKINEEITSSRRVFKSNEAKKAAEEAKQAAQKAKQVAKEAKAAEKEAVKKAKTAEKEAVKKAKTAEKEAAKKAKTAEKEAAKQAKKVAKTKAKTKPLTRHISQDPI